VAADAMPAAARPARRVPPRGRPAAAPRRLGGLGDSGDI